MAWKLSVIVESAQPPVGGATRLPRKADRTQAETSGAPRVSPEMLAEHTLPDGSTRTLTTIFPWSIWLFRSARS